jgi:peroxiredoxin (alkyl hydroperoxide reductase subunit C)
MARLVGKEAPDFSAKAVMHQRVLEPFSLTMFRGKPVILFFYPLNFTFVCPTELHAFQDALPLFEARGAQVIGVSVDSHHSHLAWLSTPRTHGGIQGVTFPLVSDLTKKISEAYDVLKEDEGISYRGLFLIDADGIVRHQVINDLPLGRSVEEALRVLDAWLSYEQHGEVCPANWHKGQPTMKPTSEGLLRFFAHHG